MCRLCDPKTVITFHREYEVRCGNGVVPHIRVKRGSGGMLSVENNATRFYFATRVADDAITIIPDFNITMGVEKEGHDV